MKGWVYYADDGRGRIKIGFSANPFSRLRELRTVNPEIEMVFCENYIGIDGRYLEQKRHDQFNEDHIAGEWFHRSQRLDEWIRFYRVLRTYGLNEQAAIGKYYDSRYPFQYKKSSNSPSIGGQSSL